jgi:hypothetical protein
MANARGYLADYINGLTGDERIEVGNALAAIISYDPAALDLYTRFTSAPNEAYKRAISNRIRLLKEASIWPTIDVTYALAAADSQAAARNWVADTKNLTATGSPTFTANKGFTGNGTSAYLDTGVNPGAGGTKATQNSACISFWCLSLRNPDASITVGARNAGATSFMDMNPRLTGELILGRLNNAGGGLFNNTVTLGHFTINRPNSTTIEIYRDGQLIGSSTVASTTPPNANLLILARQVAGGAAESFSSDQIAMVTIGSALTSQQVAALYKADCAYLDAIAGSSDLIAAFGDSLTATGSSTYLATAGGLFSPTRSPANNGIGGQTSTQVAARQGGLPVKLTVTSNQIPASGTVAVTAKSIGDYGVDDGPITVNGAQSLAGTLAGIPGTLARDGAGAYTFTRTASGSITACPPNSVFTVSLAINSKQMTQWLWVGTNFTSRASTLADAAAMIAFLGHSRYLIVGPLTKTTDSPSVVAEKVQTNTDLAALYGSKFRNMLSILQASNDGSANDLADVAAGYTPRSLRVDEVHLTTTANNTIVAPTMYNAHLANGYA